MTRQREHSLRSRSIASDSISPQATSLVRDRLVDELLHLLAEIGALRARRLRHQHRGELLLRVDPEIGAAVARPHVLARSAGNRCDAVGEAHLAAEAGS